MIGFKLHPTALAGELWQKEKIGRNFTALRTRLDFTNEGSEAIAVPVSQKPRAIGGVPVGHDA